MCQLLCASKDHIRRAITISYTCYSLCLTIFGLAPSWPLFLNAVIWNPWLTLNPSTAMHFFDPITRGVQIYLSQAERGKFHLDWQCHTTCFLTNPRTTFMTTQLQSSVWWLLSRSVHISCTCDNLRSKDTADTLCNEKSLFLELGRSSLMSYMRPHY
jgi:hypothetical protein